jgi:glucosamine-6-phosphate deaminase
LSFTVEVLTPSRWSAAVADRWLDLLGRQPNLRMSLPTGATPRPVYRELVDRDADLTGCDVFLLDEFGGLALDSPARCDAMLRSDLLDLLNAPPASVHMFDTGVSDIGAMCDRYEAQIPGSGFGLAVLGLGRNGHIGLNEPGSGPETRTRMVQLAPATSRAARAYGTSDAPTWGVTLGVGTLLESNTIWLLVTGTHKAEILAEVVHGSIGPEVPASFLRQHADTIVLADEAAAAGL